MKITSVIWPPQHTRDEECWGPGDLGLCVCTEFPLWTAGRANPWLWLIWFGFFPLYMIYFAVRNEDVANNPSAFWQHLLCSLIILVCWCHFACLHYFQLFVPLLFLPSFPFPPFPSFLLVVLQRLEELDSSFSSFFTLGTWGFIFLRVAEIFFISSLTKEASLPHLSFYFDFLVIFWGVFKQKWCYIKSDTFKVELYSSSIPNE